MKKNLKRAFILLLAMLLIASFAACKSTVDEKAEETAPKKTEEVKETETAEATPESIELRMGWWGSVARHEKYNSMLDIYESLNPNITILREYAGWGDYHSKIVTQIASGSEPDIIALTNIQLGDYASRGVLTDLQPYIDSGLIDTADHNKTLNDTGIYKDVLYMIAMGTTAPSLIINKTLIESVGMEVPSWDITWDEFKVYLTEMAQKLPEGVYPAEDIISWDGAFRAFFRQKGYEYIEDGELMLQVEDLIEWYQMGADLRAAGALPPGEFTAEYEGLPWQDSAPAKGLVAMIAMNSNQAPIFQQYTEDELVVRRFPAYPGAANEHGEALIPSALSISVNSEFKDASAQLISWFVNDNDAVQIFNAELGVPTPLHVQDLLAPGMSPILTATVEHINIITQDIPLTPPLEDGGTIVLNEIKAGNLEIAFGADVNETAEKIIETIKNQLNK